MKYIILLIIFGFISCKTDSKGLELTILNDEFVAYCPKKECIDSELLLEDNSYNKEVNVLRFKIENKSNQTYFFMPISKRGGKYSISIFS